MSPVTRVRSGRRIPTHIWVPPIDEIEFKIEIVDSSNNVYDISDEIVEGEWTDGVTETIGNFTFTIDNADQSFTNKFSLYNEIRIYTDYAESATTKRFVGLLEKISTKEGDIVVSGRSIASRVMGVTVTYSGTDYSHEILSTILTNYASYITQNNIDTTESTDTIVTVNWYQKPFWECVQELCNKTSYDAYIDMNLDFNYFVSGTRKNTTEAVVHDHNLEDVGDFTPDLSQVYNRIIVYGAKIEGIQIIWTEESDSSISSYDPRELIINDSNIITTEQARDRALYEKSLQENPPILGEVTCLGLATILPGEKIRISHPDSNLQPGFYDIRKFTHKLSSDDSPLTVLTIKKEGDTISRILKKRVTFESESTEKENPNEMRYTILYTFDSYSGTHSSTQITDGVLKTDGSSTGTWISDLTTTSENITYIELRVTGDSLAGTEYYFSTDGGNTYQTINSLSTAIQTSPTGTNFKLKIVLNSSSTQIKSAGILYKT